MWTTLLSCEPVRIDTQHRLGMYVSPGLPEFSAVEPRCMRTRDGGRGLTGGRGLGLLVWIQDEGLKLQQDRLHEIKTFQ